MKLEDYPQTHDGAAAFVRDVFCSMGGRVLPDQGQMQNNSILKRRRKQLERLTDETRLKKLERQLDGLIGFHEAAAHKCILNCRGVCIDCQGYWDRRDEIEYEIILEKEELAKIWALQSKKAMVCVCSGVGGTSLDDNIVALALTINGQR